MPNSRNQNQVNISVWIDKLLLNEIDGGRRKLRGMERSQFIRDAIKEKLESLGFSIPDEIATRPDRAGARLAERSPNYGKRKADR